MDLVTYENNLNLLNNITIGISSSGRWELLEECLNSILRQAYDLNQVSILLPLKKRDMDSLKTRIEDYSDLNIEVLEVEAYSASHLRNLFLSKVKSGILYFLDEDCSFDSTNHLKDLVAYHKALPKVALIGGRYKNSALTSPFGRAYNLVCDLWQDRNDFFSQSSRLKHLLGGNLSLKISKETRGFQFGDEFEFGGEELSYLKKIQGAGLKVMLVNGLTVHHHAQHKLETFFSRAWLHGNNKYFLEKENFGTVFRDRKLFFKKKSRLEDMALAAGYMGVVQMAYYNQYLQNDFSKRAIGQWTQKLISRIK